MSDVTISVTKNGPINIKGTVLFKDYTCGCSTVEATEETDIWLCRCGMSKNKPFCDGSHKKREFRDTHTKNSK